MEWECVKVRDTLGGLSCSNNQTVKWDTTSQSWQCGTDLTGDTAGNLEATTGKNCVGLIIKNINGSWTCAPDLNTDIMRSLFCPVGTMPQKNSSSPIGWGCTAPFVNTDTLASLNCAVQQIPVFTAGGWVCGSDKQCTSGSGGVLTTPPVTLVNGGFSGFGNFYLFLFIY